MTDAAVLDPRRHAGLRVITARSERYGDAIQVVPVVANELKALVTDYPVFLMKDPQTGRFGLWALLGLEAGENLFLGPDGWTVRYVPLHIRRQPFLVGRAGGEAAGQERRSASVAIDMASPRVGEGDGESLFEADGSPTEFLRSMSALLSALMSGTEATAAFIDAIVELSLVEPVELSLTLGDGSERRFEAMYTVGENALAALSGEPLERLHRKAFLQAAFLLAASSANLQKLIDRKNRRMAAAGAPAA